jgi:hypothetical protein
MYCGLKLLNRIGACRLALTPGATQNVWVPVNVRPENGADTDLFEDISLFVTVAVSSPDFASANGPSTGTGDMTGVGCSSYKKPCAASMDEVFVYPRSIQGPLCRESLLASAGAGADTCSPASDRKLTPPPPPSSSSPASSSHTPSSLLNQQQSQQTHLDDYRGIIADCYEWMWYAGFQGIDPLTVDDTSAAAFSNCNNNPLHHHRKEKEYSTVTSTSEGKIDPAPLYLSQEGGPSSNSHGHDDNPAPTFSLQYLEGVIHLGDGKDRESDGNDSYDDRLGNFQSHFETSRMSVFEFAPAGMSVNVDPEENEFFLSSNISTDNLQTSYNVDELLSRNSGGTEHHSDISTLVESTATMLSVTVPDVLPASLPVSVSVPIKSAATTSPNSNMYKKARVDVVYPLDWIKSHIEGLQQLALELGSLVPRMKNQHKTGTSFRCSALKKNPEWQALPVNLHYQLMSVRQHASTTSTAAFTSGTSRCGLDSDDSAAEPRTEVIHSVTCGAMTPHMMGHKSGGLYHQESKLVTLKLQLDQAKLMFNKRVSAAGSTRISTSPSEPQGVFKLLVGLGSLTQKYESQCLAIGHRRAYAMSQALSIAVNSLMLKLGLTLQGYVPADMAERWMEHGILLVFEGLLSVVSNERSMLEDTISAVDALRGFQLRLLPFPDEPRYVAPLENEATNHDGAVLGVSQDESVSKSDDMLNEDPQIPSPGKTDAVSEPTAKLPSSYSKDGMEVGKSLKMVLKGREVLVYVPAKAMAKFPRSFQEAAYGRLGGAVVPFFPVLFTQVCFSIFYFL